MSIEKYVVPTVLLVGSGVVAACTVVCKKVKDLSKKFDSATKDLADISEKEIKETMMQKAVEEAADAKMAVYCAKVHNEVLDQAKAALKDEARSAVNEQSRDIKEKAAEAIEKQVADINIDDLKKKVRERAEEKIADKFVEKYDGKIDELTESLLKRIINRSYSEEARKISLHLI